MGVYTDVMDAYDKIKILEQQLEQSQDRERVLQKKLDNVAEMYKELKHKNKLISMALIAANNGNDTNDIRYSYNPEIGIDQLNSLCHGVVVHIHAEWLTEIIGMRRERVLREALNFIANQSKESIDTAFIYNVHNYINELKLINITAKEALEESK